MPEPIRNLQVKPGCQVEVELSGAGGSEYLTFTLVADEQADFDAGFLGLGTPLAKTLLGKLAGQTLPYRVGDLQSVKILSVQPQGQTQTEDVAWSPAGCHRPGHQTLRRSQRHDFCGRGQ
jgi:hypothetical protein